jgi:anthranilate synthase component 2
MILIIDNYDSFTYNLYQYIGEIYDDVKVVRNDDVTVEDVKNLCPEGIVLSPGPGRPENSGVCIDVIRELGDSIPVLGICLGHQAIGFAYGGNVVRAKEIMHGKVSSVKHDGKGLFKGIKNPLTVMRYHSLIVEKEGLPEQLEITAETNDGVIMGLKHKGYPVYGLQFHPESILTEEGKALIRNYLEEICNVKGSNKKNS